MDPERIESIKAGGIAALTGLGVGILLVSLDMGLSNHSWIAPSPTTASIVRMFVAIICAFLFGVTYRYIVRQDQNPHLRSGAVGAFALTRSLSQLENSALPDLGTSWSQLLPLALPVMESFGFFLVLRLVLDWALSCQLIRPFRTEA